jgi:hypothetical protein
LSIIDNAKEIADLIKKAGDIDLYKKIVELEGEIIELTRLIRELEEQNTELKQTLKMANTMIFKAPFYFSGEDPQPYCPRCWEADCKAIHLTGPDGMDESYECPECERVY